MAVRGSRGGCVSEGVKRCVGGERPLTGLSRCFGMPPALEVTGGRSGCLGGGSDGSRRPLQTDFKTADTDVNTDQDIEKNLVGTEALW